MMGLMATPLVDEQMGVMHRMLSENVVLAKLPKHVTLLYVA
jgi:hypothetical protein